MTLVAVGMIGFGLLTAMPAAAAEARQGHVGWGVALLLIGLALVVVEALTPTIGIIGTLGLLAFVTGSVLLFNAGLLPGGESLWGVGLIVLAALIIAGFLCWVVTRALRLRREQPRGGQEAVLQAHAVVLQGFSADAREVYRGHVRLHGERWQARSEVPVQEGDTVRVTALDGLTATVVPLAPDEADGI
ncbi:NfeD family protein [Kushneria sinocarnis]|uniref:NfeD family protein n=1 Tax=Kushneria sinocarnis TaxID=595502 RepID=UPI0014767B06|nr:NfeD family protein [Kushneria sinocarnis]